MNNLWLIVILALCLPIVLALATKPELGGPTQTLPSTQASTQVAEVREVNAVSFIWPVRGRISSPFGPRIHPIYGVPSFHTGIDIAVPEGTAVQAAAAGIVTFAAWEEGAGLLVIIEHGNGYETYYAHLSKLLVWPGRPVSAGEVIALSGNTGLSSGPHLHFEVRYRGVPIDPRPLLP